jgi:hypothetical protein
MPRTSRWKKPTARAWDEKQHLIDEGMVRGGPYTVGDAVRDYLEAIAEKGPKSERTAKYVFDASILPEFGTVLVEKLTTDRLVRWRNALATRPKRVRTKRTAARPATRETSDDDDARRKRKATANRIITMLKAALNRAFAAGRGLRSRLATRQTIRQGRRGGGALSWPRGGAAARCLLPAGFSTPGTGGAFDRLSLFRARPAQSPGF